MFFTSRLEMLELRQRWSNMKNPKRDVATQEEKATEDTAEATAEDTVDNFYQVSEEILDYISG